MLTHVKEEGPKVDVGRSVLRIERQNLQVESNCLLLLPALLGLNRSDKQVLRAPRIR